MNGLPNDDQPITFDGIVPFDNHPANTKRSLSFRALKFIYAAPLHPFFSAVSLVGACAVSSFFFRNFSTVDFRKMAEEAPELKRDSTMTVTAKVRERSKAREHRKIFNPKVPRNAIE